MIYNDFFSATKLKTIFNKYSIKPKKSLGQNFLIDRNIADKIIKASDLSEKDQVIEVGAGCGVLTAPIAERVRKLIAYEVDQRLIPILREVTSNLDNVEVRGEDILRLGADFLSAPQKRAERQKGADMKSTPNTIDYKLPTTHYKLIGNFPYYISSRILRYFLSAAHKPKSIVVVLQKDVAERICARSPNMSLLAVAVQFYGMPKIISQISKNCFWPRPNVDSALVRIEVVGNCPCEDEQQFFTLIKAGFANRRKMLINNLRQEFGGDKKYLERIFCQIGLKSTIRAQELSVGEWRLLISKLKSQN